MDKSHTVPSPEDEKDVMLNGKEFFGFCEKFEYLGTTVDSQLRDDINVKKRIQKASGAFAAMKKDPTQTPNQGIRSNCAEYPPIWLVSVEH